MASTSIHWFRRDLRLTDNAALWAACQHKTMIPVYIFNEEDDPWPMGAASRWWLHHGLAGLHDQLNPLGQTLILRTGDPEKVLRELTQKYNCGAVYWNRLYEPYAQQKEHTISQALQTLGVTVQSYPGYLLQEPWDVVKKDGTPYRVYTAYWKVAQEQVSQTKALPKPKLPPPPKNGPKSIQLAKLNLLPKIPWDHGIKETWQVGEGSAHRLLKTFVKSNAQDYHINRDLPALTGTSRLSPYLHFGHITPKQVWHALQTLQIDVTQFKKEMMWREFASHLLFHFPHTPLKPMNPTFANFPWRRAPAALKLWQQGKTGYPIVDAGMRELWQTGWMHNRVRMITASFLVKHLRIHWLWGAKWFWDTLVDADLANNTMGWQWVAGCGADAAPYFRIFNPIRQGERFDAEGLYVKSYIPQLQNLSAKWIHQPWLAEEPIEPYASPQVDHDQARQQALAAYQTMKERQ